MLIIVLETLQFVSHTTYWYKHHSTCLKYIECLNRYVKYQHETNMIVLSRCDKEKEKMLERFTTQLRASNVLLGFRNKDFRVSKKATRTLVYALA